MPLVGNQFLEARYQWIPEHGYVLTIKAERLEVLERDLAGSSIFSHAIPKIPAAARRRGMLRFISSTREYFNHVGRSVVYYEAESGKDKLEIWNLASFTSLYLYCSLRRGLRGLESLNILGERHRSSKFNYLID
jgi:hypothetical protein